MSRETILTIIENKMSVIPGIAHVTRKPIDLQGLEELPSTKFPAINVIGGLPLPLNGKAIELGSESYETSIRSNLNVFIKVFGQNSATPDTDVSTLLNLVYQNLLYDPNLKGYDYTDKATDVPVDTGTIIFRTEQVFPGDTQNFKLLESQTDRGVVEDLSTLPYSNPAMFTDVTDSLAKNAQTISVRSVEIVQYEDPFFSFMLVLTVQYKHKSYLI